MLRRWAFRRCAALALAALAGLAIATDRPARAADGSESSAPAPKVTVAKAQQRELVETAVVTGTLVARDEVLVGPEIEGLRIVEILADEGEFVAKDQVLARLARDVLEAQLARSDATLKVADASIEQAKSQIVQMEAALSQSVPALSRARDLVKAGAGTQAALEQRATEQQTNEARLTAAKNGLALTLADKTNKEAQRRELLLRLAHTEIRAPSAGLISRRTARLGAIASSISEPLFRIISNGQIELEAEVPQLQVVRIVEGQTAAVTIGDGITVFGRVRLVSPEIDRTSRLGKVRIALANDRRVRIGAFARATIETQRRRAIAVPMGAVLFDGADPFVQIVESGKIIQRKVKPGLRAQGLSEIVEGISQDDLVVVRAAPFLREGDRVTSVEATLDLVAKPSNGPEDN
jgi:HlyD family secretion protein